MRIRGVEYIEPVEKKPWESFELVRDQYVFEGNIPSGTRILRGVKYVDPARPKITINYGNGHEEVLL